MDDPLSFRHAEAGLTRFPPNIEQLTIERGSDFWLVARRNDIKLRFPLSHADRRHLAELLLEGLGTELIRPRSTEEAA